MAKLTLNSALNAMRGTVDGLVYKTINGRTFLTKRAVFRNRQWSGRQRTWHERWAEAAKYAKAVWADPEAKAFYVALARRRKAWRAFSLAMGDAMNAPEVTALELLPASGGAAAVRVEASDDVGVVRVEVLIRGPEGTVVERAEAQRRNDMRWWHDLRSGGGKTTPVEVEARVYDRPGNCTVRTARFG